MNTIGKLRTEMSRMTSYDTGLLGEKFRELARLILEETGIRKGKREYRVTEAEFYLYTPAHPDVTTYPRSGAAAVWFFHPSGVDISFESRVGTVRVKPGRAPRPCLDSSAAFGGILLRGICPREHWNPEECAAAVISGPRKVREELFNPLRATEIPGDFPVVVPLGESRSAGETVKESPRRGLLPAGKTARDKAENILRNYCRSDLTVERIAKCFAEFSEKPYRFNLVFGKG